MLAAGVEDIRHKKTGKVQQQRAQTLNHTPLCNHTPLWPCAREKIQWLIGGEVRYAPPLLLMRGVAATQLCQHRTLEEGRQNAAFTLGEKIEFPNKKQS